MGFFKINFKNYLKRNNKIRDKMQISKPIKINNNVVIIKLNDKRILNQNNLNLKQIEKNIITKKKEEKLNIFSNSHYLNLEKKLTLKLMNNFGIVLGEPNSINSEILAKSIVYKKKAIIIGSYDLLKVSIENIKNQKKIKKIKKS